MSLFPFIDPFANAITAQDTLLPLYKEVAWDFERDMPAIENSDLKIVEGDEALKVWCYKAIKTTRREHSIYSWNYGCEVTELLGRNYTPGLIKAEAKRFIKEALLINPYVLEVIVNDISFSDGLLSADIKINTIYNKEVTLNV